MRVYYDRDADLNLIKGKKVAIIGYGSQGHAHALNLKESGVKDVAVGLRPGSKSAAKAEKAGLKVMDVPAAAKWADVVMMLTPDELQAGIWENDLKPNMKQGAALFFAHGLNIHFNLIEPRADMDVCMVAPKGPGHTVRAEYAQRRRRALPDGHRPGFDRQRPRSDAVLCRGDRRRPGRHHRDESFREECETDLFGEQSVLCGGLVELMRNGYETLIEAGYSPEMAYFECVHEVKLIVDLIYEGGIANMNYSVSNTAEYGEYVSGPRVVGPASKQAMKDDPGRHPVGQVRQGLDAGEQGRSDLVQGDARQMRQPPDGRGRQAPARHDAVDRRAQDGRQEQELRKESVMVRWPAVLRGSLRSHLRMTAGPRTMAGSHPC